MVIRVPPYLRKLPKITRVLSGKNKKQNNNNNNKIKININKKHFKEKNRLDQSLGKQLFPRKIRKIENKNNNLM